MTERPLWIQSARYTFLQTAIVGDPEMPRGWTPIQECLNEACNAYDELLGQYEALVRAVFEDESAGTFPHLTSRVLTGGRQR